MNDSRKITLGIDTSTGKVRAGLYSGDSSIMEELDSSNNGNCALLGLIDEVLTRVRLSIKDIHLIGIVRGPGSFTGIRVGLATVLGITRATGAVARGVTSLEQLAYQFFERYRGQGGTVRALVDAQRGQVYAADFRVEYTSPLTRQVVLENEPAIMMIKDAFQGAERVVLEPSLAVIPAFRASYSELEHEGVLLPMLYEIEISGSSIARNVFEKERDGYYSEKGDSCLTPFYMRLPAAVERRCQK